MRTVMAMFMRLALLRRMICIGMFIKYLRCRSRMRRLYLLPARRLCIAWLIVTVLVRLRTISAVLMRSLRALV